MTLLLSGGAAADVLALLGTSDRSGDRAAAVAVHEALLAGLSDSWEIVDPAVVRDARRRLRVRNSEDADLGTLRRLAGALAADWLAAATVHDAGRRDVPILTVSLRVYHAREERLVFAGFDGASGLDGRKVLGLGTVRDLESLVPVVTAQLIADLESAVSDPGSGGAAEMPGRLAVLPFDAVTELRATANAEAVTAAARAVAFGRGWEQAVPPCVNDVLRTQRVASWGEVGAGAVDAVRRGCEAGLLLAGTVEQYEIWHSQGETRPRVAVSLRLIDGETGRLLWIDALEMDGWKHGGPFRLGRIYSPGDLTKRLLQRLSDRMRRSEDLLRGRTEEQG